MRAVAIIAAGGASRRMGFNKTITPLAGIPLLARTLQRLAAIRCFSDLIAAVPAGSEDEVLRACVAPFAYATPVRVVAGGPTRVHSVWNALRAVPPTPDLVAIHDGARPFVAPDVVRRTLALAREHGGAIAALPMIPTVKRVHEGRVVATLDRRELWCAATPQVFRYGEFLRAYELLWQSGTDVATITDDAQIFERAGGTVMIVESNPENVKLTTPFDWRVGELLAAESPPAEVPGAGNHLS